MPWHKSYRHRYKFTIDNTNIDSNLTDFPVALFISSSCGTGADDLTKIFDTVGARWANLCVTAGNEKTPLWTEVDLWDETNEVGVLHVRVPKISSSVTTDIFLYFDADGPGNGYIGETGSDAAANVWDDNFVAVYHMGQDPSGAAPQILDSTSFGAHMTSGGSMTTGDLVDGEPGKGIEFDGGDDSLSVNIPAGGISDFPLTMEVAGPANVVAATNTNPALGFGDNGSPSNMYNIYLYGSIARLNRNASEVVDGTATLTDGVFCHIAATFADATTAYLFTDGADKTLDSDSSAFPSGIDQYWIGSVLDSTPGYRAGIVSEARYSDIVRSDAWIKATYYTLADNVGAWDVVEGITSIEGSWLGTWQHRLRVTIDADLIDGDLTNFPVALHLNANAGIDAVNITKIFDELGANSHKFAVTDHTGIRQLFVEVDYWSESNLNAVLHVSVPHVDSDTDTVLYFYYDANQADNDSFVDDPATGAALNVWDTDFWGVYHLNEAPNGTVIDSSPFGNHMTPATGHTFVAGDLITAFPGMGVYFSGNNHDVLSKVGGGGVATDYPAMIEVAGIYDSNYPTHPYATYCKGDSDSLWLQANASSGYGRALLYSGATYGINGTQALVDGEFCHIVGSWEDRDTEYVFTNGGNKTQYVGTIDRNFPPSFSRTSCIGGKDDYGDDAQEGITSEVRFSRITRSDAWVKATYYTLADKLLFWDFQNDTTSTLSGWVANRIRLTIDSTKINDTLTDFPVTIFLNGESGLINTDMTPVFDELGANSLKIAVTTSNGQTQCYVEVENWDDTNETAVLHVKVPSISAIADTVLYLYYDSTHADNTTYVGVVGSTAAQNVWDSDFGIVLHMDDASAMVNAVDGATITYGGSASFSLVDGPVTGSTGLEANADTDILDMPSLAFGDQFTIEAQHYINAGGPNPGYDQVFGMQNTISLMVDHTTPSGNERCLFLGNGSSWDTAVRADTELGETTWYSHGVSYDQGAFIYTLDGAADGGGSGTNRSITTDYYIFGRENQITTYNLYGILSELRISTAVRLPEWQYATQHSLVDTLITAEHKWTVAADQCPGLGWLKSFTKRIKLTVDNTNIDNSFHFFPLPILISSSCGATSQDMTAIFDEIGANSKKLAVTAADGRTQLPVEVEHWDDTGEEAVLHVRLPAIEMEGDSAVYLYFSADVPDNHEYVGTWADAPGMSVWNNGYSHVFHFEDDTDPRDSSPYRNHGTESGTASQITSGTIIGNAREYSTGFFKSLSKGFNIQEDGTYEALFYISTLADSRWVVCATATANNNNEIEMFYNAAGDATMRYWAATTNNEVLAAASTAATTWYFDAVNWSDLLWNNFKYYRNGAYVNQDSAIGAITAQNTYVWFGERNTEDLPFDGYFNEIRISNVRRGDNYIKATYESLYDNLITFAASAETEDNKWLGSWANRIKVRIDSSKIGATLTNFPVAVKLSGASGLGGQSLTDIFAELGANSLKIAVTEDDGYTQTYAEVAYWDATNEIAELHVLIPSISSTEDTVFYIYYDADQANNTTYIGVTGAAAAEYVWDTAGFEAVYHMNQDPSGSLLDSTSNGHDGTFYGSMDSNDLVESPKGMALDFDGSDDYITTPNSNLLDPDQYDYTYEVFFNTAKDYSGGYGRIYGDYGSDTDNWIALDVYTDNKIRLALRDLGGDALQALGVGSDLNDGAWHHSVMARDTLTHMDVYEDGAWSDEETNGAVGNIRTDDGSLPTFGRAASGTDSNYFKGRIGEVRLTYNVALSADWVAATYYTLMDELVYYAPPETIGGWPTGWGNRIPFVIPATNIDADLTSFPVALVLGSAVGTGSDDITAVFDEVGANYKRVMVGDANGNPIPAEIEHWDDTGEEAVIHAKVPYINSDSGTVLFLYYNDDQPDQGWAGATGDYIAQRVWSNGYVAVYNMATDPSGADAFLDSTENGFDGTMSGTMLTEDLVDGTIGKAIAFEGSDDRFTRADNDLLDIGASDDFTIEAVINRAASGTSHVLVDKRGSSTPGYIFGIHSDNTVHMYLTDSVDNIEPGGDTTLTSDGTAWYFVGGRFDRNGDNDADVWLNAADDVTAPTSATLIGDCGNSATAYFCDNAITSSWANFNGKVQTLRLANTYRSDAWMKANYYSLFDNLGAWGEPEIEPAGGEIEVVLGKAGIVYDPKALTDELYIELWLGKAAIQFQALPLATSYIGNVVKLVRVEGSRPRIAAASSQRPGIAKATGGRPGVAAAEAFAYQAERDPN